MALEVSLLAPSHLWQASMTAFFLSLKWFLHRCKHHRLHSRTLLCNSLFCHACKLSLAQEWALKSGILSTTHSPDDVCKLP